MVQTTKSQGEQNAAANQRSYELTLHQINLQYKANVYKGVIQFMAKTHIWFTARLDSLSEQLAEPTHPLLNLPRQLDDQELDIFVALELHASAKVLAANLIWDEEAKKCSTLFDELTNRDVNRDFNQPSNPQEEVRIGLLNQIRSHLSELDNLEKAFLDTVKADVRLEPPE